jgi:hypothetical protein
LQVFWPDIRQFLQVKLFCAEAEKHRHAVPVPEM